MKLLTQSSLLALAAAAFISTATIAPALAAQWSFFQQQDVPPPDAPADGAVLEAAKAVRWRDGSYTGGVFDAYYGPLQVQATIQGGRIAAVNVLQFPNHQRTSRAINGRALPALKSAAIRSQATRVNMVSGATLTSRAFARSLKDALSQAGG